MESAGRTVEEKEVSAAMRDCGLGTPATRAATLETLLRREYLRREDKSLHATETGIALVAAVHPRLKSPAPHRRMGTRASSGWSAAVADFDAFMRGIETFVPATWSARVAGARPREIAARESSRCDDPGPLRRRRRASCASNGSPARRPRQRRPRQRRPRRHRPRRHRPRRRRPRGRRQRAPFAPKRWRCDPGNVRVRAPRSRAPWR